MYNFHFVTNARVVELVDTRDLKSLASNGVPVQVRLRVPHVLKLISKIEIVNE